MVQNHLSGERFLCSHETPSLFKQEEPPAIDYPIQAVHINWDRLAAKRQHVLDTVDTIPLI